MPIARRMQKIKSKPKPKPTGGEKIPTKTGREETGLTFGVEEEF